MTNKEAIEVIKSMGLVIDAATSRTRRKSIYEALALAINALEERPQGSCKELLKELKNCRNELCLKCGKYNESYKGACDDCRYNFENMKKWEAEND